MVQLRLLSTSTDEVAVASYIGKSRATLKVDLICAPLPACLTRTLSGSPALTAVSRSFPSRLGLV